MIAIDRFQYRLDLAREPAGATETINYDEVDVRLAERPPARARHGRTLGAGPIALATLSGTMD